MTRFSESVHPLLTSNQQYYAHFRADLLNTEDFSIAQEIATQLLGAEEIMSFELLEGFMGEYGVNTGVFTTNGHSYYFAEDHSCSYQDQITEIVSEADVLVTNLQIQETCYSVFSQAVWRQDSVDSSYSVLKTKLLLAKKRENQSPSTVFVHTRQKNLPIIGYIYTFPNTTLVLLGESSADFDQNLQTKQIPKSLYSIYTQEIPDEGGLTLPVDIAPLANFSGIPGEFHLYTSGSNEFTSNLYDSDTSWRWVGAEKAAQSLESMISSELADQYPIAVEQELPDGTLIVELQENKDAFKSTSVDSNGNAQTLYTYPEGQIVKRISDNTVLIEKNPVENPDSVDHNCVFPDSFGYGQFSNDFIGTNMWASAQFSYDQQKMILCFKQST